MPRVPWSLLALGILLIPTFVQAQSMSSVRFNETTVTVNGGSHHALTAENGLVRVIVDDHLILIDGETVTIDGATSPLPRFKVLAVTVANDGIRIIADGETVVNP